MSLCSPYLSVLPVPPPHVLVLILVKCDLASDHTATGADTKYQILMLSSDYKFIIAHIVHLDTDFISVPCTKLIFYVRQTLSKHCTLAIFFVGLCL